MSMEKINDKSFISLKKDLFYYAIDEGIYFRNNIGYFIIHTKEINLFISLLDMINKKKNFNNIILELTENEKNIFLKIIKILKDRKCIRMILNSKEKNEEDEEDEYLENLLLDNNYDIKEYKKNLEQTSIIIGGNTNSFIRISRVLNDIGITNLKQYEVNNIDTNKIHKYYIYEIYEKCDLICIQNILQKGIDKIILIINLVNNILLFMVRNEKELQYLTQRVNIYEFQQTEKEIKENIYNVLQENMLKLVIGYTKSDLEEKYYVIDTLTLEGKYYLKKINNECGLFKYIQEFSNRFLEPIVEFTRKDLSQLPFSQWMARIKGSDENITNILAFGDTHEETRINICTALVEQYIKNVDKIGPEYEIACVNNENELIQYSFLKYMLKNVLGKKNLLEFREDNIDNYKKNRDVKYYRELLSYMKQKVKILYSMDNESFIVVKVLGENCEAINIGFNAEQGLINTLRLYIFMIQNEITTINIENINSSYFKYITINEDIIKTIESQEIEIKDVKSIFAHENLIVKLIKHK